MYSFLSYCWHRQKQNKNKNLQKIGLKSHKTKRLEKDFPHKHKHKKEESNQLWHWKIFYSHRCTQGGGGEGGGGCTFHCWGPASSLHLPLHPVGSSYHQVFPSFFKFHFILILNGYIFFYNQKALNYLFHSINSHVSRTYYLKEFNRANCSCPIKFDYIVIINIEPI